MNDIRTSCLVVKELSVLLYVWRTKKNLHREQMRTLFLVYSDHWAVKNPVGQSVYQTVISIVLQRMFALNRMRKNV